MICLKSVCGIATIYYVIDKHIVMLLSKHDSLVMMGDGLTSLLVKKIYLVTSMVLNCNKNCNDAFIMSGKCIIISYQ